MQHLDISTIKSSTDKSDQNEPKSAHLSARKRFKNARTKAATSGHVDESLGKIGGDWRFFKNPKFLKERISVWDELMAKQQEVYKSK